MKNRRGESFKALRDGERASRWWRTHDVNQGREGGVGGGDGGGEFGTRWSHGSNLRPWSVEPFTWCVGIGGEVKKYFSHRSGGCGGKTMATRNDADVSTRKSFEA